mmetsp:Transcript_16837/g.31813  ORF Transcript_16837/g.31813 Transcript_16837/m.31813 type:complete len:300 (-) Transcript_16837:2030-2929(-)
MGRVAAQLPAGHRAAHALRDGAAPGPPVDGRVPHADGGPRTCGLRGLHRHAEDPGRYRHAGGDALAGDVPEVQSGQFADRPSALRPGRRDQGADRRLDRRRAQRGPGPGQPRPAARGASLRTDVHARQRLSPHRDGRGRPSQADGLCAAAGMRGPCGAAGQRPAVRYRRLADHHLDRLDPLDAAGRCQLSRLRPAERSATPARPKAGPWRRCPGPGRWRPCRRRRASQCPARWPRCGTGCRPGRSSSRPSPRPRRCGRCARSSVAHRPVRSGCRGPRGPARPGRARRPRSGCASSCSGS